MSNNNIKHQSHRPFRFGDRRRKSLQSATGNAFTAHGNRQGWPSVILKKKRNAPASLFTTNAAELLEDDSLNIIIELIDDADAAFQIVSAALRAGKAVVSANKKMIATHLDELLRIQRETGTPFLYEAAACASIPVIRNLEEYYDNDLLQGIQGIVNGSTNYILSKVSRDGLSFGEALEEAQLAGFAESDPP